MMSRRGDPPPPAPAAVVARYLDALLRGEPPPEWQSPEVAELVAALTKLDAREYPQLGVYAAQLTREHLQASITAQRELTLMADDLRPLN